jgi:Na+-transporting methylmalonyl-CoA/oxaloacetate decarboxylase gamma subunit
VVDWSFLQPAIDPAASSDAATKNAEKERVMIIVQAASHDHSRARALAGY